MVLVKYLHQNAYTNKTRPYKKQKKQIVMVNNIREYCIRSVKFVPLSFVHYEVKTIEKCISYYSDLYTYTYKKKKSNCGSEIESKEQYKPI